MQQQAEPQRLRQPWRAVAKRAGTVIEEAVRLRTRVAAERSCHHLQGPVGKVIPLPPPVGLSFWSSNPRSSAACSHHSTRASTFKPVLCQYPKLSNWIKMSSTTSGCLFAVDALPSEVFSPSDCCCTGELHWWGIAQKGLSSLVFSSKNFHSFMFFWINWTTAESCSAWFILGALIMYVDCLEINK